VTARAALYLQKPESRSILTVRTDEDSGELTVSLQTGEIAVAIPLRRDDVQVLIATLDDFLYDSRP
jgi:hypothetical protein